MNTKATRTSRYTLADAVFVYDLFRTYTRDDFVKLSITNLHGIAKILRIRCSKQYSKSALIDEIVQAHNKQAHAEANTTSRQEEEENEQMNETKQYEETVVVKATTTSDALTFSDQLKQKFIQIRHYKYNNDIWFQGSAVAGFLEYESTRQAINEHVNTFDKMRCSEFLDASVSTGYGQGNQQSQSMMLRGLHPETLFINNYGIFDLITKSRMPLARQFRKWLVDEVIPSIMDTGVYVSPALTQRQLLELQVRVQTMEIENQQAEARAQAIEAENHTLHERLDTEALVLSSPLNSNQTRNIMNLEDIYILTTRRYESRYIYKVGRAGNTPVRVTSLNTGHIKTDDLFICHKSSCYDARSSEQFIHLLLHRYRVEETREFFIMELNTLRNIVDRVCQSRVGDYSFATDLLEQVRLLPLPKCNPNKSVPIIVPKKEQGNTNVITKYFKKVDDEEQVEQI